MKFVDNKNFDLFINDLIYLIKYEENSLALELLKERLASWFIATTWKNIKKFPNIPLNFNHLISYWEISLLKSIYIYDSWLKIPFCQFSIQQYNWFLLSYLRSFTYKNYAFLNYSLPYDENDFHFTYKIYRHNYSSDVNSFFDKSDQIAFINQQKDKIFTNLEKIVFEMRLEGYNNREISTLKKWNYRIVDNAWQRIKRKIFLKKNYQW